MPRESYKSLYYAEKAKKLQLEDKVKQLEKEIMILKKPWMEQEKS